MQTKQKRVRATPTPRTMRFDDDDIHLVGMFITDLDRRRAKVYATRTRAMLKDVYGALVHQALDQYEAAGNPKLIQEESPK